MRPAGAKYVRHQQRRQPGLEAGENLLLITPTKMNKGDIRPRMWSSSTLKGKMVEGNRRPTGETPMYLKFFNLRPDIVSVIHCHPPSVCAMAIIKGKNWLMRPLFPETNDRGRTGAGGAVRRADYRKVGEQLRAVPPQIQQLPHGEPRPGNHDA